MLRIVGGPSAASLLFPLNSDLFGRDHLVWHSSQVVFQAWASNWLGLGYSFGYCFYICSCKCLQLRQHEELFIQPHA